MLNNALNTPIIVLGEALMDCISQTDGSFIPHLGGSPYNVARVIAKQGQNVYFLNPLSTDDFGEKLYQQHVLDGVTLGLPRNNLPTSLAMVSFHNGQPSYQFYRQGVADIAFTIDQALQFLSAFKTPGILHTGSLALIPPESNKTLAILTAAKALGWTISIDINVRPRLATDMNLYCQTLWSFISIAHWLKTSDEDLHHLLSHPVPDGVSLQTKDIEFKQASEIAQHLMQLGCTRIAVTFGAQGAFLSTEYGSSQATAPQVPVQDTVGAGDTFWGTCLVQWLQTQNSQLSQKTNTELTLIRALTAAALNCMQAGCKPPSLNELNQRLETHPTLQTV